MLLHWGELAQRAKEWETGRGDKEQRLELSVLQIVQKGKGL